MINPNGLICRGCPWSGECDFNDWLNCQRVKELNNRHPVKKPKPTNFDNVTASPEALAEFVIEAQNKVAHRNISKYPWCYVLDKVSEVCPANCRICLAEWFKQEAKEEKKNDKL